MNPWIYLFPIALGTVCFMGLFWGIDIISSQSISIRYRDGPPISLRVRLWIEKTPLSELIIHYPFWGEIWFIFILIMVFLAALCLFHNLIPALMASIICGLLPMQFLHMQKKKYQKTILKQFAAAVRIFLGEYTQTQQINPALRAVGEADIEPVAGIFKRAHAKIIFKGQTDEAYKQLADELNISEGKMFVQLLKVAGKQGPTIVPLFVDLVDSITDAQHADDFETGEVEGERKISLGMSILPVPIYFILQYKVPEIAGFLSTTVTGRVIVTVCFLSVIVWCLIDRLLGN